MHPKEKLLGNSFSTEFFASSAGTKEAHLPFAFLNNLLPNVQELST